MADKVDLTNCDREPIHLLGRVQKFGCLVALTHDWKICHVSQNAIEFLGMSAQTLLGAEASLLLPREMIHDIRNKMQYLRPFKDLEVLYNVSLVGVAKPFDISFHTTQDRIVLELEVAGSSDSSAADTANMRIVMDQISGKAEHQAMFRHAVTFIKIITGFDRVMMYRFLPDDSGEVVAEARSSDMASFLNLRYPASDIPKQARALYLENPIRIIADVGDDGVPILGLPDDTTSQTLDLSGSRLRSVSPIHLEYLRNMGVGASMSISVIVEGTLWGLIACHHNTVLLPNMKQRNNALLFGQLFSLTLQSRLARDDRHNDERIYRLTTQLSKNLASESNTSDLLEVAAEAFYKLLNSDGFAVVIEGTLQTGGHVPPDDAVRAICGFLSSRGDNEVFSTHHLEDTVGLAEEDTDGVAGLLSVPVSRSPRDYILFFRSSLPRKVTWAGNPAKPAAYGPNGARLTPRKSFAAWQEEVHGQSEYWTGNDIRAATQLRIMLLEVVLRLTDQARLERKSAMEKQELLIAELNHRVRNILGLVRGLISQTNSGDLTTKDFVKKLDSRIQALARAHDQITRQNWSPTPFSDLLETEAESYLLDKKDRIVLQGPHILLSPKAYSSVALVMHEMMTNSAKYGALSDQRGTVKVTTSALSGNAIRIDWEETGGPAVEPPSRRGYGSAIIEKTIPYELSGQAEISYAPGGVTAWFLLPEDHVTVSELRPKPAQRSERVIESDPISVPEKVLVVEDNLIIAMEAEHIFSTLGCTDIHVAPTLVAGLKIVEDLGGKIGFALLDINLGDENSYEIARELVKNQVPFVFASGYGDDLEKPDDLETAQVISKPYDADSILSLFSHQK